MLYVHLYSSFCIVRLSVYIHMSIKTERSHYLSSTLYHGLQCKGWPNSGWCSDAGYEPSLNPGLWEQAWDENGECEIETNPTGSPTSNPTELPTGSPTSNPTESPTRSPTSQPTSNPTAGCIPNGGSCDMNQPSSCCSGNCEGSNTNANCY